MQTTCTQQFHLILDPLFTAADGGRPRRAPRRNVLQAIQVPDHPVALTSDKSGATRLVPAGPRRDNAVILEPVRHSDRWRLLCLAPPVADGSRINGLPAPLVALLDVGDQILHHNEILHVTIYPRPPVGRPTAEQVGQNCLLCRGTVSPADSVYACACGGLAHVEAQRDNDETLECTKLMQECTRCRKPLIQKEGFSFVPDRA